MSALWIVLLFGGMLLMLVAIPFRNGFPLFILGLIPTIIGMGGMVAAIEAEADACEAAGGIYVKTRCFDAGSIIELEGR